MEITQEVIEAQMKALEEKAPEEWKKLITGGNESGLTKIFGSPFYAWLR